MPSRQGKTHPEPDLSEFLDEPSNKLDRIIGQLSPERRASLEAALAHPAVKTTRIWERLNDWGFQIARTTVTDYRKKFRGGA